VQEGLTVNFLFLK